MEAYVSIRVNQVIQYYEHALAVVRGELAVKEQQIAEGIRQLASVKASSFRRILFWCFLSFCFGWLMVKSSEY